MTSAPIDQQVGSVDLGRTGRLFADIAAQGRTALVGFLHVGYPSVPGSLAALRALTGDDDPDGGPGVDLVEVGMPYSDPMMDGVTIQRAGTRALQRGVRTRDAFAAVETVARTGTAAVVMTYWNLIERYGPDAFARDLAAAGGSGAITPDLTPDEAAEWFEVSDRYGLDRIFLVSPSSSDERISGTVAACRGWVYATAVMGVTGVRSQSPSAAPQLVGRVRDLVPGAQVGVGVGVADGRQAADVARYADAVIVGSALVATLLEAEDRGDPDDLSGLRAVVADLAAGVRVDQEPEPAPATAPGTSPEPGGLVQA